MPIAPGKEIIKHLIFQDSNHLQWPTAETDLCPQHSLIVTLRKAVQVNIHALICVITTENSILGIAGQCCLTVVSSYQQGPFLSCVIVHHFQPLLDGATTIILPCALLLVVLLTGVVLALGHAGESHWGTITFLLVTTLVALVLLGTSCSWGIDFINYYIFSHYVN